MRGVTMKHIIQFTFFLLMISVCAYASPPGMESQTMQIFKEARCAYRPIEMRRSA